MAKKSSTKAAPKKTDPICKHGSLARKCQTCGEIEDARREAFGECRARYLEITRGNRISFLTFEEWLLERAEGRGE